VCYFVSSAIFQGLLAHWAVGNKQTDASAVIRSRILQADPTTIILLACEQVSELSEGENVCLFETEHVRHSLEIGSCADGSTSSCRLDFVAEGVIQSLLHGDHPHTPMMPLSDLWSKLGGCQALTSEEILRAYQERALSSAPRCYPCDTDFIGIITSKLVMVNGIHLDSPVELAISKGYIEVYQESGDMGHSSWESCLDLSKIEEFLGTHQSNSDASKESSLEFDSVTALRIKSSTVSADDIANSYSQGVSYGYSIGNLVLMIEEEESPETAGSGRLCVDLLASGEEAAEALKAIDDLMSHAE
jgi:hypothetical protein